MDPAKWFPKLKYSTPLRTAARCVIAPRIRVVEHYAKLVTTRPGEDSEHVHQLRVATRRLAAAISVFKSCLEVRACNELRLATRRLRRAAGRVRDLDVLIAMLESRIELQSGTESTAAIHCRQFLGESRRRANASLLQAIPRWLLRFRRVSRRILNSLGPISRRANGDIETLGSTSQTVLRKRHKKLIAAWRSNLGQPENLHQLRIAAKRLRYAMEIFATCFSKRQYQSLYDQVESIQTDLGEVNDLRNLIATLLGLCRQSTARICRDQNAGESALMNELRIAVEHELHNRITLFLDRWPSDRRHELRRRFKQILKRPVTQELTRPRQKMVTGKKTATDRWPRKL